MFIWQDQKWNLISNKKTIEDSLKAIKPGHQDTEAYLNRGNMNYNLENYKEAIENYTRAIELDPQYAESYFNRSNANCILGKDNPEEAIKYHKRALEDYKIAKVFFKIKKNKKVVERCEDMIATLKILIELESYDKNHRI